MTHTRLTLFLFVGFFFFTFFDVLIAEFKNALNSLLGLSSGNAIPEITCAEVFRYFDSSAHGDALEG